MFLPAIPLVLLDIDILHNWQFLCVTMSEKAPHYVFISSIIFSQNVIHGLVHSDNTSFLRPGWPHGLESPWKSIHFPGPGNSAGSGLRLWEALGQNILRGPHHADNTVNYPSSNRPSNTRIYQVGGVVKEFCRKAASPSCHPSRRRMDSSDLDPI